MHPQALMKVINAVVLIEDLGTSHVEVAGQFCIVLITNNHVFKTANAAKSSRIKFEGHNDFIGLSELMIKDSYKTRKEVSICMHDMNQYSNSPLVLLIKRLTG